MRVRAVAVAAGASVLLLTGCGATTPVAIGEDRSEPSAAALAVSEAGAVEGPRTFYFVCERGYGFAVRFSDESAQVYRPEGEVELPQERAASGVRYSDGVTTLWTKGDEALLETVGALYRNCRNDPARAVWEHARLNGVEFRAIGNEPGWVMQFFAGTHIVLDLDYGTSRHVFDLPEPEVFAGGDGTRYRTERDGIVLDVVVRKIACSDTMSDAAYDYEVLMSMAGRTLRGCGRRLR